MSALLFWLMLMPWLVRNYIVFDGSFLLRGDFGVELHAGNNPEAQGWWVPTYTFNNPALGERYEKIGELEFVAEQGRLARQWIAENPRKFLAVSFRRVVFFWAGIPHEGLRELENLGFAAFSLLSFGGLFLAIKRRVHGVFLFATLVLFYPIVYYITFATPRYRHAIEPELLVLAVYLVSSVVGSLVMHRSSESLITEPASVVGAR